MSTGRIVKGAVALLVLGAVLAVAAVQLGPFGLAIALVIAVIVAWIVLYQWQLMRGLTVARDALAAELVFSSAGVQNDSHWWFGRAVMVAAGPSEVVALRMDFARVRILWRAPRGETKLLELLPAGRSSKWSIGTVGHKLTLRTSKEEGAEAAMVFGGSVGAGAPGAGLAS